MKTADKTIRVQSVNSLSVQKRIKPPVIHRIKRKEQLISFLEKRKERKLFLIQGKAGQGKSTLAMDFLSHIDAHFMWYRIYEDDRDPVVLLDHFLEGIENTFNLQAHDFADTTEETTQEVLRKRVQTIISILSSVIDSNFYIVFDDLHNLNSSEICCEVINLLMDWLPTHIHVVITSTTYPLLDFIHFRSDKELVEVFNRDLTFSFDEIKELSREIYEIDLDQKALERLMVITRGWITGITYLLEHLSKMQAEEQRKYLDYFFNSKYLQSIDDFFREEVIKVLPGDMASILIRTSLFDEITPEIIDLFNEGRGEIIFKEIKSSNIFIESEFDETMSYNYTPLFSSFLKRMFNELPEPERNAAFQIAGDYCLKQNEIENAIDFLFKSNQREKAEKVFIDEADRLLDQGEYEVVQKLLNNFSKPEIGQNPLLSYYDGIVMNLIKPFSSRTNLLNLLPYFREKKDHIREARIHTELLSNYFLYLESEESVHELTDNALKFLEHAGQSLPVEKREILEALATLGTWWVNINYHKPYEAALRAEEASYRFQNDEAFLCSRLVLSKIYIYKGKFSDSLKLVLKTEKFFEKYPAKHPYLALIRFALGDSYFYLGNVDKAIEVTEIALENVQEGFGVTRFLELNLVFYYLYTEEYEKAESIFESKRVQDIGENLYLQYFWIYLLQMLIAYRNGNKSRSEYYCNRLMEPENEQILQQDYPYSYTALGEINIFTGNFDDAEKYLRLVLNQKMEAENPYVYATAFALLAYLQHLRGDSSQSKENFIQMNKILKQHQYRNLDICSPALLQQIAKVSGLKCFDAFHRLESDGQALLPSEKQEKNIVQFKTLGTFQVFINGEEIQQHVFARQKKVTDLLKFLIVFRRNGISKEVVYETFWARYSVKSARDNLNTVVYRLRKIFGEGNDFISTDMNIIKLKEGTYSIDVDLFNQYIENGNAAERNKELETALSHYINAEDIYKGDFLETGLYLDFIRDEREHLRNKYRQLLFNITKITLDLKQYPETMKWANKLISFDPICEPAYRLLMISSALTGNRIEVSRIYKKLKISLMENYNISPDAKTEKLKNDLLAEKMPLPNYWDDESII